MSVELVPNSYNCHQMGVSNGTFGNMIIGSGIADYLGLSVVTNDPITVTEDQAKNCRALLSKWIPPEDWGGGIEPEVMKEYFDKFFRDCGGFTTR